MATATAFPLSGYTAGQCTYYVASMAPWVLQLGNLGNGGQWLASARAAGAQLSSVPYPGSVAVWAPNKGGAYGDGHVALVTGVQGNGLPIVSEMNWTNGPFKTDTRNVPASSAAGIVGYILPPNAQLASTSVANAAAGSAGQTPSTSGQAGSTGSGLSLFGFQVISHQTLVRIGYTMAGLSLVGIGVWIVFRKEADAAIKAVTGSIPKALPV